MIVGVGIDVCGIERFAESLARTPRLRERLFTERERELPLVSLAARFAAKEALAKALGAPPALGWHDAEVLKDTGGRPVLHLRGTVLAVAEELGASRWHVSLSHDAGVATAFVVLEAERSR